MYDRYSACCVGGCQFVCICGPFVEAGVFFGSLWVPRIFRFFVSNGLWLWIC